MKATGFVIFIIHVIFFFSIADGFRLFFSTYEPTKENLPACRVVCDAEPLRLPNTGNNMSTGEYMKIAGKSIAIERLSLFKGAGSVMSLLAEVSSTKNKVKTASIEGIMTTEYSMLQVNLTDVKDCQGPISCHVFKTDGSLKVLSTHKPDCGKVSDEVNLVEQRLSALVATINRELSAYIATIKRDLSAQLASAEERRKDEISEISTQLALINNEIFTQSFSTKEDFTTQIATLKKKIISQVTSAEQRIAEDLTNLEQRQKSDLSDTEQSLTVGMFASEEILNNKMTQTERNIQITLSQFEDKLHSALQAKGDVISCSSSLSSALKEDIIKQFNHDLVGLISQSLNSLANGIRGNMQKNYDYFEQAITDVKTQLDEVFDYILILGQNVENAKCKQDKTPSREASSVSCMTGENLPVLKHSQCKKGMLPMNAPPKYPYPIFLPDNSSVIDRAFLCDTSTGFGGWILVQRRSTGNVSFYRDWAEYKAGFGSLDNDFWLGLDAIHQLTKSAEFELRIDLKYQGNSTYALYSNFSIDSEAENYRLHVGSYSGTAGDSLNRKDKRYDHNGMEFSTKDKDNDLASYNCATKYPGAWWYNSCLASNLNGVWQADESKGLKWNTLAGRDSVTFSEMKIRKIST